MKIKLDEILKTLDGQPIEEKRGEELKSLTLKDVCVNALLTLGQVDQKMTGSDRNERFLLALKINDCKEFVDLQSQEIVFVKDAIGKIYLPLVVGRSYELLEGICEKKEDPK